MDKSEQPGYAAPPYSQQQSYPQQQPPQPAYQQPGQPGYPMYPDNQPDTPYYPPQQPQMRVVYVDNTNSRSNGNADAAKGLLAGLLCVLCCCCGGPCFVM